MQAFIVFVLMLWPFTLYSQQALTVSCPSCPSQEVEAGETVAASFLVSNLSTTSLLVKGQLDLPPHWSVIPHSSHTFSLQDEEQIIQLFAIKTPSQCAPGEYLVHYTVFGLDDPDCQEVSEFKVVILPYVKIKSNLEQPLKSIFAGDSYAGQLYLFNSGNAEASLIIQATNAWQYPVRVQPSGLQLKPGEACTVDILIDTAAHIREKFLHLTQIEVFTDTQECVGSHSLLVDIYPIFSEVFDPYRYVPVHTTFGYGEKNHKKQIFIEAAGGGPLNEEKTKNISFLLRAPIVRQANLVNELYGIPESNFVHYWTPYCDAYAGDGIYCLTPLTLCQYGTGALLSVYPSCIGAGAIYLNRLGHQSSKVSGGFLAFTRKYFSVMGTLIQTHLDKHDQRVRCLARDSHTFSLNSNFKIEDVGQAEVEWATSEGGKRGQGQAYYLYGEGTWKDETDYNILKIHADPHFVGYYSDMDQFNASVGFPIKGTLRGTLSYKNYQANLKKSRCKCSATRDMSSWIGVNYAFPSQLYMILAYNQCQSKDVLLNYRYRIDYMSLTLGKPYSHWNYQASVDIGQYEYYQQHKRQTKKTHHHLWQNYQLYLTFNPRPFFQYCVYTRLGYHQFSNRSCLDFDSYDDYSDSFVDSRVSSARIDWAWIYGLCGNWNFERSQWRITFERTKYSANRRRHFLAGELHHTLANSHLFSVKGVWNRETHCRNEFKILFTYTIPWWMPVGRNPKLGCAKGEVVGPLGGIPHVEVRCQNGKQLMTSSQGKFAFPSLRPGTYHLWIDEKNTSLVTKEALPIQFEVEPAKQTELKIEMVEAVQLSGQLMIQVMDPVVQAQILLQALQEPKEEVVIHGLYREQRGWENAIIQLHSEEGQGNHYALTDAQGVFFFNKLSPGKWTLKILTDNLPAEHYIEENDISLELSSQEQKKLTIRVLPIERQLRLIDQSDL